MTALRLKKESKVAAAWLFAVIAILFNPISPIYLSQDAWRIADIVVAAIFALTIYVDKVMRS